MSAKIYYLRPVQREKRDGPATPPFAKHEGAPAKQAGALAKKERAPAEEERASAEEEEAPPAVPKRAAGKRAAPGALPGGRNSKWKRKLGGGMVLRDAKADDKDDPSKD